MSSRLVTCPWRWRETRCPGYRSLALRGWAGHFPSPSCGCLSQRACSLGTGCLGWVLVPRSPAMCLCKGAGAPQTHRSPTPSGSRKTVTCVPSQFPVLQKTSSSAEPRHDATGGLFASGGDPLNLRGLTGCGAVGAGTGQVCVVMAGYLALQLIQNPTVPPVRKGAHFPSSTLSPRILTEPWQAVVITLIPALKMHHCSSEKPVQGHQAVVEAGFKPRGVPGAMASGLAIALAHRCSKPPTFCATVTAMLGRVFSLIVVELIYSVPVVSDVQEIDSVIRTCIYIYIYSF